MRLLKFLRDIDEDSLWGCGQSAYHGLQTHDRPGVYTTQLNGCLIDLLCYTGDNIKTPYICFYLQMLVYQPY